MLINIHIQIQLICLTANLVLATACATENQYIWQFIGELIYFSTSKIM